MDGSGDEESDQFFETLDEMVSVSDSGSDNETLASKNADPKAKYEIWTKEPGSIQERRQMFLKQMGFINHANSSSSETSSDSYPGIERLREDSGAVLRNAGSDPHGKPPRGKPPRPPGQNGNIHNNRKNTGSPNRYNASSGLGHDGREVEEIGDDDSSPLDSSDELICKIKNLDSGKEFVVDELGEDGMWNKLREVGSNRRMSLEEFERFVGVSSFVRGIMRRGGEVELPSLREGIMRRGGEVELPSLREESPSSRKSKRGWLKALSFGAHSLSSRHKDDNGTSKSFADVSWDRPQRTKVRQYKKSYKEFSALYMGQEILAHDGSIWTMKFSLDGRFLATAGEDRVIQVREVIESERKFGAETPDVDGANAYFTVNGSPEVFPLNVEGHATKGLKVKCSKRGSNSDCIVLPDKIFSLSEKPLCYFHGHEDDILDLSWSSSQLLLSSSADKTVRLWDLERQCCLKMFAHSNFVTCIQFNPVDERFFISGSLDGKVRIWSIPDRRVVDWSDIRETVTAASYSPDGQRGLVGSVSGICHFYDTSGNNLQLETQVDVYTKKGVYSKKKNSSGKKITGFQFAPGESRKVLITYADSRIRAFDGHELVCKYKGFRNTGSQISASFTSNGKHVVCASEDSNVYIWNYEPSLGSTKSKTKTFWSHEHFLSENVLVAVPWSGMKHALSHLNSPGSRHIPNSLPKCKDTGRYNGFLSRETGEDQELTTALHCGSQESDLSSSDTLVDSNDQDGLSKTSAHLSDSYEPRFTPFSVSPINTDNLNASHGFFSDSLSKGSATWPEEKLPPLSKRSFSCVASSDCDVNSGLDDTIQVQSRVDAAAAWGLVIVTAGLGGEIRSFQNYGLPVHL